MLESIPFGKISRLWRDNNFDWVFAPSIGNCSGLLVIWDKGCFNGDDLIVKEKLIALKGTWIHSRFQVVVCNVYAPCKTSLKIAFWEELLSLKDSLEGAWCLARDFNSVVNESERKGCVYSVADSRHFVDFINICELVDLPLVESNTLGLAKENGFLDLVHREWLSFNFTGSASFCLSSKLSMLKSSVKKWNSEVL
ncbi:hypothetical protein REPUB_Repub03eG0002900 [Reevesia pubescens]